MNKNNLETLEQILKQSTTRQHGVSKKREKGYGVIYTRVSSQEQAENNGSLEIQRKYCDEFAARQGIYVKAYFGGTYESAKTDGRKEFTRMLSYVEKDKEIAYIIVYNLDRFSRTGHAAAQITSDLRNAGIYVKSATQDIDTSTPTGRFSERFLHLFNNFDNETKSERTSTNMREVMLKGYWPFWVPLGYKNLKPKHRAVDHKYIITEEGKLLKKAFEWKIEGSYTNKEICEKLRARGLKLTEKNFRFVISNPFYAGYITGKLLNGELIKGHHPALISLETFLKANKLLATAVNTGIPKKHKIEDLPLKIFAKDEISGAPLTGFKQKGIWYYKGRGKEVRMTVNALKLNNKFINLLKQYEYKKKYLPKLKAALLTGLKKRLSNSLEENVSLKKRISESKGVLEKMEERFVLGELSKDLYIKYTSKYRAEITELESQLSKSSFQSSNLEKAVGKALLIAQDISQSWLSGTYDEKQKLQYLLFPEGIFYNKENDRVQTQKENSLFAVIPHQKRVVEEKIKGNSSENCLLSDEVTPSGFKPETF